MNRFLRTEWLIGKEGIEQLKNTSVAIFGIGGVGSYVAEGLARSGIGSLVLIDNAKVDISNLNRQIHATERTVGKLKIEAMRERLFDINPNINIRLYQKFILPGEGADLISDDLDYIVDAVDTVAAKVFLVKCADKKGIPIISSMGTGNKLDATKFEVDDIFNTSVCPLARIMRKELKKTGIKSLKVVYSKEEPIKPAYTEIEDGPRKNLPASIAFVPSVAGLIIAGEVVKDIIKNDNERV